jgi:hypothetical protein
MTKGADDNSTKETPQVPHHDLWAGIDLKLENALFHFEGMGKALRAAEPKPIDVALRSFGGGNWHRAFYAHLDAFLSAARSIPGVIQCCFGKDDGNKITKGWFACRDASEQKRRQEFSEKFKQAYDAFRSLPLGSARHISEHRTGFPPATVTITGRFGITYSGNPITPIPPSETRELPPEYAGIARPTPVVPRWTDFEIDGQSLFPMCSCYLDAAQSLINLARDVAKEVHGDSNLTSPPQEM